MIYTENIYVTLARTYTKNIHVIIIIFLNIYKEGDVSRKCRLKRNKTREKKKEALHEPKRIMNVGLSCVIIDLFSLLPFVEGGECE